MKCLLSVKNLNAGYLTETKLVRAVRDVSFDIKENEFLGIAGESGCGKSTLAFAVAGLLEHPGKIISGDINFDGKDLINMNPEQHRKIRWKDFSIVFQASMNVLNPVMKIRHQIYDAITTHINISKKELGKRAEELLDFVNVLPEYLDAYPHQLSGGMKQRVVIAIALALNPKLIIMDEPTTALDVVVQRSILQEIDELKKEHGFSIMYITHDLSLLVEISETIAIMYAGQIVEKAPSKKLYANPLHPYTNALMTAFPPLTGKRERLEGIKGYPPELSRVIHGCAFYERCPKRIKDLCNKDPLPFIEVEKGHIVACQLYSKEGGK
ncbi:MAG: ABC transporter ATP-binding protein [Candidatus Heimdallarchaeota archaeon]|nr:ABC transporter ATP-binding protein [Candidatus Heimdallarchaeota archaeon]